MNFRRGDNSKINHYFQQAQHISDLNDPNAEEHLVEELQLVYEKISFKEFVKKFLDCLKLCLIHPEETPGVDAVLNFAAKFVVAINGSGTNEDETCPFLTEILEFACSNHGCDNHFVRSRLCSLVDKLLCKLGNEVVIDTNLYNKLVDSMLERMKDKMPGIRVRAISAVYRLQDPFDTNCPVVKALSFHLGMDPSVEVRRAILRKLAVAPHTLPTIVERIYDVKDFVRKDAFLVLSKCSMSRFTILQRQRLLYSGLKDRDERVSKCVEKVLLPLWFDHAKNNFVNMLKSLDVERSTETSFLVLQILFKSTAPQTISEQLKGHLNDEELIPLDKLSPENAFFWRCAVHYIHNLDEEAFEGDKDYMVQSLLPELTPLTNYIREYFLKDSEDRSKLEVWEQNQRQFILLQLLQLCNVHDLSDELGRTQLKNLCTDLLLSPHVKKDAVSVIVDVFSRILPNIDNFLDALVEIIMDLKEPFKDDENTDLSEEETDEEKKEKNEVVKISPDVLSKCLTIVVEFMQNKDVSVFNPCLRSLVTTFVCPALEARDTASRVLALHALSNCCLLDVDLAKQYFLLFCFQIANDDMCVVALKGVFDLLLFYGLGTFKLTDQIDESEEKKTDEEPEKKKRKLKGAMVEDNSFVSSSGDANTSSAELSSELTNQSANLITMLMSLMDSYTADIRHVTVEGLCKLIIGGRITSVNLLSKLMIMWFSPVSEEQYVLRQQLGTFFNVYASSFAGSHYMFQQAFLPTLKTLYDAPMDSPLHEIDPDDVAKLMINLILVRMNKEKGPNPHNSLALAICKEILNTYSANLGNVPVLVRSLLPLQLSCDEPGFLEEFQNLAQQVLELLEDANNKVLAKYMKRVLFKLDAAKMDDSINPADVNNTEPPSETLDDNMNTVDDSMNDSEGNTSINASTTKSSKTIDLNAKVSPRKSGSMKPLAETSPRGSDKENADSNDVEDLDGGPFDELDSDAESTEARENSPAGKSPKVSASPVTANRGEYTLTRINLRRTKVIQDRKAQKAEETAKEKSPAKKSAVDVKSSDAKANSVQTRKSSRKKGREVTPTPLKKSRLQLKFEKTAGEKEKEKAASDSEEGDNEDSDEVTPAKRERNDRSHQRSPEKIPGTSKREVRGRVTRAGKSQNVAETANKRAKSTPAKSNKRSKKGTSGEDTNESTNESDEIDEKSVKKQKTNLSLRSKTDNIKETEGRQNKATPRKLIEVENIGKEPLKRKAESSAQPDKENKGSPNKDTRNTRSAGSSGQATPSKETDKSAKQSPTKLTPVTETKIKKSPDTLKLAESKIRLGDLEILEEISRRTLRVESEEKKTRGISESPIRKNTGRSESPEKSPPRKKAVRHLKDAANEEDSEAETSPISVKSSPEKAAEKRKKKEPAQTSKASGDTKDASSKGKSEKQNPRKSLRVALIKLDIPDSRNRKSVTRRSQSASVTSATKSKPTRRSSSARTPAEKSSMGSKNELKNTESLLRQVLTPKQAPQSSKKMELSSKTTSSKRSESENSPSSTTETSELEKSSAQKGSPVSAAKATPRSSRRESAVSEIASEPRQSRSRNKMPSPPATSRGTKTKSETKESPSSTRTSSAQKTSPAVKDGEHTPRSGRKESPASGKATEPNQDLSPDRRRSSSVTNSPARSSINSRQRRSFEVVSGKKTVSRKESSSPEKEVEPKNRSLRKEVSTPAGSPAARNAISRGSKSSPQVSSSPPRPSPNKNDDSKQKKSPETKSSVKQSSPPLAGKSTLRQSRPTTSRNTTTNNSPSPRGVNINLSKRQSARKKPTTPEKISTLKRVDSSSKTSSARKTPLSEKRKDTRSKESPKEKRGNESPKKKLDTPRKSLSPVEKVEAKKSLSVKKKTPSPKILSRSSRRDQKTSSSVSRRTSSSKGSPSPSIRTNSRRSSSARKKNSAPSESPSPSTKTVKTPARQLTKKSSPPPKKSVSPSKTVNPRSSRSPIVLMKKTSLPKRTPSVKRGSKQSPSPVTKSPARSSPKNSSPSARRTSSSSQKSSSKSPSPAKKMRTQSFLPVRKTVSKQSQPPKKGSSPAKTGAVPKKAVSKPNFFVGKKMSVLARNQLAVKKSVAQRSLALKKKTTAKQPVSVKKVEPKRSVPVERKSASPKKTASPSTTKAKITKPPVKQVASGSKTTVASRSRSLVSQRVRKTPSKLLL